MICSLVSRSVSETLIVRSNGSMPLWTFSSVSTVACMAKLQPSTERRNRLRVTSIFLASEISSSRVSSGISAICDRYIRTGSSLSFGESTSAAGSGVLRSDCRSSSASSSSARGRRQLPRPLRQRLPRPLGRLGDQLDSHLFQRDQQTVELFRIDGLVGQIVVHLVVGQISLGFALGDQFAAIPYRSGPSEFSLLPLVGRGAWRCSVPAA